MIPGFGDKANEYPFKLRPVDNLEYETGNDEHCQEIVSTILLENGVEPGREYEGQLWILEDYGDNPSEYRTLGWLAGGPWSTKRFDLVGDVEDSANYLTRDLSHQARIVLAVECARSVFHLVPKYDTSAKRVIELIDKRLAGGGLGDDGGVSNEDISGAGFVVMEAANQSGVVDNYTEFYAMYSAYRAAEFVDRGNVSDAIYAVSNAYSAFINYSNYGKTEAQKEIESVIRRCLLMPIA